MQTRSRSGKATRRVFEYVDNGNLATIGRNRAFADIRGLRCSEILAFLKWVWMYFFYERAVGTTFGLFFNELNTSAPAGQVGILAFHGAPDAPTVDVGAEGEPFALCAALNDGTVLELPEVPVATENSTWSQVKSAYR